VQSQLMNIGLYNIGSCRIEALDHPFAGPILASNGKTSSRRDSPHPAPIPGGLFVPAGPRSDPRKGAGPSDTDSLTGPFRRSC
jgi:hypothetical protein